MATLLQQKNCMTTTTTLTNGAIVGGGGNTSGTNGNSAIDTTLNNKTTTGTKLSTATAANTILTRHDLVTISPSQSVALDGNISTTLVNTAGTVALPLQNLSSSPSSSTILINSANSMDNFLNNQQLDSLQNFGLNSHHNSNHQNRHNQSNNHHQLSTATSTSSFNTRYFSQFSHHHHNRSNQETTTAADFLFNMPATTVTAPSPSSSTSSASSFHGIHNTTISSSVQSHSVFNTASVIAAAAAAAANKPPITSQNLIATSSTANNSNQQNNLMQNKSHEMKSEIIDEESELQMDEQQHQENIDNITSGTSGAVCEEEQEPEIDIVINNVVCSFSVRCHLNLREIALNGVNVEFRRENGMVTMRLRRPYTTASIWSSGRITCTGATSEDQAKVAARRYARCLQKLGFKVRFNNYRVVNVLGTCSMPWAIKIVSFSEKYKKEASYEPELHPGVTYKLKDPKATLKIFSTGSITVTASSVTNVQAAIEHIFPLVYEFRKKRTPEEIEKLKNKKANLKNYYDDNNDVDDNDNDDDDVAEFQHSPINSKRKSRKRPLGYAENDPDEDIMYVSDCEMDEDQDIN